MQLIKLCNQILEFHIVEQRLPLEKQETSAVELDIQWLAKRLVKARIEANQPAYQSWLATAYWCTQLARARLKAPPNEISYTSGGKHKRVRLHLFEKTKATKICNSNKPSKLAT